MYDVIIIGGGSAGIPAGIYASRYQLSHIIIGEMLGGALSTSHCVENYPGTISAPGAKIMEDFQNHALAAGCTIISDRVEVIQKTPEGTFLLKTISQKEYHARRLILATGNRYKQLGVPGEMEYYGQGVSYCATCDGNFYKNLIIALVGGGNTAISEAIYLSDIAKEVHVLIRSDRAGAEAIWIEKARQRANIFFHYYTQVREISGDIMGVKTIHLVTTLPEESPVETTLEVQGVFIAIGSTPTTELLDSLGPKKDGAGYICVDARQETSLSGIYAAGDVTTNSNRFCQTIMSAAEGCLAAHSVHEDLLAL